MLLWNWRKFALYCRVFDRHARESQLVWGSYEFCSNILTLLAHCNGFDGSSAFTHYILRRVWICVWVHIHMNGYDINTMFTINSQCYNNIMKSDRRHHNKNARHRRIFCVLFTFITRSLFLSPLFGSFPIPLNMPSEYKRNFPSAHRTVYVSSHLARKRTIIPPSLRLLIVFDLQAKWIYDCVYTACEQYLWKQ